MSDSAMRGFPFASQGLDVLHCHADARLAKGADAEAAVQAAFETLGPERITRSTPDLPACLAELPALPLCNEQGQLRALPMAAVLRQLSSVMQARDTDLARLSDRTAGPIRCERQMFAMPGWLRKASNFDQVRLRKERTKVREAAQELNCWAQCLADSGDVSVSLADASELSKSLDALMRRVWRSDSRIEEALRRLQVQVEGSVATQYRTSVEDLLYRKYAPYRHPGARSEWRLDAGVGAAAGTAAGVDSLSVGATAGATFGVSRVRALGNDDEGFVQESCGVTRSVAAHVATSLSGAAKALLSAKALTQKTVYVEYDGIRHLVESPDSRVQRARFREIGKLFRHAPFKVRSLGDLTRRQNDAAFQEASLARATGGIELPTEDDAKAIHRVHTGLRAPVQKPPAVGVARRIAVQGDAAASIGLPAGFGAQAALSGGVASTRVRHDVLQPFWNAIGGDRPSFRLLDADELDDPARSDSLDMQKRRQAILQGALGLAPALARLGFPEALPPGPTKALVRKGFALSVISDRSHLHRILQRMEDQFDLYCLAGREVASGKREAAALMRDFERIWNVKGRMRETAYVQKVCLAHNAIALRLRQLAVEQRARGDSHAAARWHADWTRLDAFWNKLRTPDLPHRQVRLLPHIAFRDILCPSSTERHVGLSFSASGSWSLAGSTTGLGVAANVSVSASFRQVRHPNYLREGDYIDLKFDFGGSGVVAAQYGAVLQALNGLSSRLALPPELLEHAFLLTGTTPLIAASVEGGVQLMLRLFRPAFRTDPDAAYRLQFARVLGTQGGGCSIGKVTVPIGPASASVEAGGRVRHTRLLDEWLGEDTLTYVMLRYNRMRIRAPFDDEGEWSDFVVRHRKAFEKMFARLGDVDSAVCKEAQFMMDQLALGARKADRPAALAERDRFGEAMRRYRSSRSGLDFYNARVCFEQMLARQLTRWQEVRVAARRHWELDDRIRFVS
ncbi:hypothetical protein [Pararobbsia alpina]|uniref:hypothetical protein n=1 Tax=Pararobbsia alpina TaxID=621374 RepID=UPI001582AF87|nr:hypothetical protein [Pararobbsia alpina]